MAKSSVRFKLQRITSYRGVDFYLLTPNVLCVIFLGAQIHSSFSVGKLMDEVDRYWKSREN